jgi:glucose/arabinose dehydrogenase
MLLQSLSTLVILLAASTLAQSGTTTAPSCSKTLTPKNGAPVVASGYSAQVIAQGLTKPRGIIFDSKARLLVVQQGKGIVAITFDDQGGVCLGSPKVQTLVEDNDVCKPYIHTSYAFLGFIILVITEFKLILE